MEALLFLFFSLLLHQERNQFRNKIVSCWLGLVCRGMFCCITWKRSLNSWTCNLNVSHILSFMDVAKCAEPTESFSLPRKRTQEQLLPLSSCLGLWAGSVPPPALQKGQKESSLKQGLTATPAPRGHQAAALSA